MSLAVQPCSLRVQSLNFTVRRKKKKLYSEVALLRGFAEGSKGVSSLDVASNSIHVFQYHISNR